MTQSPRTYFRSIGTAASYQNVGTITVTASSAVVTGSGTAWLTANRGRGDRLGPSARTTTCYLPRRLQHEAHPDRPRRDDGDDRGRYTIARQFGTLQEWEDCISFTTDVRVLPGGERRAW